MVGSKKLKNIFSKAAEIAESVPEEYRETAFNRALDRLLGEHQEQEKAAAEAPEKDGSKKKTIPDPDKLTIDDILDMSFDALNHATEKLGVEGLSPDQIASSLNERFGLNLSRDIIADTLENADNLVQRTPGAGSIYRLIRPSVLNRNTGKAGPEKKDGGAPRRKKEAGGCAKQDTAKKNTPKKRTARKSASKKTATRKKQ
jgi:hypothetical protein